MPIHVTSFYQTASISYVMVNMLASSVVDCGFVAQIKPKTIKLVFVVSPLSMQY